MLWTIKSIIRLPDFKHLRAAHFYGQVLWLESNCALCARQKIWGKHCTWVYCGHEHTKVWGIDPFSEVKIRGIQSSLQGVASARLCESVVPPAQSRSVANFRFSLFHLSNEGWVLFHLKLELMAKPLNANCTFRAPFESHGTARAPVDARLWNYKCLC